MHPSATHKKMDDIELQVLTEEEEAATEGAPAPAAEDPPPTPTQLQGSRQTKSKEALNETFLLTKERNSSELRAWLKSSATEHKQQHEQSSSRAVTSIFQKMD